MVKTSDEKDDATTGFEQGSREVYISLRQSLIGQADELLRENTDAQIRTH